MADVKKELSSGSQTYPICLAFREDVDNLAIIPVSWMCTSSENSMVNFTGRHFLCAAGEG